MNFSRIVIFLTFWNFVFAEMNPALFFDWLNEKLVEVSKFDDKTSYAYCISACPAASNLPSEKLLNDKISITKKSLFLRHVYFKNDGQEDTFANEMEMEICEDSYTPTLVWNYSNKTREVGYEEREESTSDSSTEANELPDEEDLMEMYTNEKNESFEINTDLQEEKLTDDLGKVSIHQKIEPPAENLVKITEEIYYTEFEIIAEPEKKWIFLWIKVLSFTISKDRRHKLISFKVDQSNDYFHKVETISDCETYFARAGRKIGNTNGPEKDFGIQIPDIEVQIMKKLKKSDNHLVKTQIIPMRMFHTTATRQATCVYLNFAFIWETIANGMLKKIDLFVYAIHRELLEKMFIYFGVYGDLQELDSVTQKEVASDDDHFSKYHAPKVIFRVVRIPNLYEENYGVIIVIHNDLKPVKDTDRICSTEDEVQGWNDIKNTNSSTGFSYTCPHTEEILLKLGFDRKFYFQNMKHLKLNEFTVINDITGETECFLDKVKNRLKRIKELNIVD